MAASEVDKIIRDIKAVRIQGAREVAKAGLRALEIEARKSRAKTKKAFVSDIEKTVMRLVRTRPTEPGLQHLMSGILVKLRGVDSDSISILKKSAERAVEDSLDELEGALKMIAKNGASLIKSGDRVLTHCHSHSVVEIFREAKRQGKKFRVIVTETRPLYQGIMTAKDLLKSGIQVTYSEDSAVGYLMKDATKVLVGCDAILPDGSIVNKIGTFPIAVMAREFGRPFYSAGGTIKITKDVKLEMREAGEIIEPKKLPGARIVNPAFDVTPSEFIESIITERGIYRPDQMIQFAQDMLPGSQKL